MSCSLEHMLALVDARSAELTEMRTLRERIAELESNNAQLAANVRLADQWYREANARAAHNSAVESARRAEIGYYRATLALVQHKVEQAREGQAPALDAALQVIAQALEVKP